MPDSSINTIEQTPLLSVAELTVIFNGHVKVVDRINFSINSGETFALVGESGSGKSMTALSVLRLLPHNAQITAQHINLTNINLLAEPESALCKIRGQRIGFIFQDPMSSLNPVMTIGEQIAEAIQIHTPLKKNALQQRVLNLLQDVEIPTPEQRIKDYPHQLSGGQRQRVMIAIALAGNPDLLIADEPTTSLDVTLQAQILTLLKNLQRQYGMALWFISHDLALVSTIANRVAVMQKGKIVEIGTAKQVLHNPQHPYTQKLIAALPTIHSVDHKTTPQSRAISPLLQVKNFSCYYPIRKGLFKRIVDYIKAVDDVSFNIARGKTLALVGESGCGKTTLGKSLLHLIPSNSGQVIIDDIILNNLTGDELRQQRANIQIIFQDPFSSMNPRMLVGDVISEGLRALFPQISQQERQQRVRTLLAEVGLPDDAAWRYPHEFSGGQRQRICIARALAVEPKLIVCDEPTSALDVSIQAQIIDLLKKLQKEKGVRYLFISHDLAVVAEMSDEIAVMYKGKIIEYGSAAQVLKQPQHAYTQKLLAAFPDAKH